MSIVLHLLVYKLLGLVLNSVGKSAVNPFEYS
jgi:hypothetical protein